MYVTLTACLDIISIGDLLMDVFEDYASTGADRLQVCIARTPRGLSIALPGLRGALRWRYPGYISYRIKSGTELIRSLRPL